MKRCLTPFLICLAAAQLWAAEIIAHRGASHDAPENTSAAFKLGYQQGADAGELDIHLTKDDQIVVMHDADTSRTAGVRNKIAAQSLDELIRKAKEAGLDGLDLNFKFPIDRAFAKKVHDAGLKLYTWTVDDPAVARQHVEAGVDGITTNRPQWLREQLALKQPGR